jgi:26S proteasome regulatory subunit N5
MEIEQPTLFSNEIEQLLAKEKVARMNNDHLESARLITKICQMAYEIKEWDMLNQLIKLLAKKRGQPKKALIDMVQLCMKYVEQLPTIPLKLNLIEAVKEVCEKKIFLEVEYARCCLMLVKHKEDEENINEAAKILQEVQVETYGSMDKREKLEFILYQMKIMIKKKDYVRLYIISKKINKKSIQDKGIEDLKVIYYSYLVIYFTHEKKYFENAECFKAIYDTLKNNPDVKEKMPKVLEFDFSIDMVTLLENYIAYLVLCTHNPEQVKHFQDLKANYAHDLEAQPRLDKLVDAILATELISTNINDYNVGDLEPFSSKNEHSETHTKRFRKELIQHNLRIIEKYYDRVSLDRIAKLIGVDTETAEAELCEMINNKLVFAKVNRLDSLIDFRKKKNENETLNDWRFDLHKILDLVDQTSNLITREYDINATA